MKNDFIPASLIFFFSAFAFVRTFSVWAAVANERSSP
jgi:hypothetical protein